MKIKTFWYSLTDKCLVDLVPSSDIIEQIAHTSGQIPSVANSLRLSTLEVVPVLPIWVYGTLMKGQRAHSLIKNLALPEFKPQEGYKEGVLLYTHSSVPYPAALLKKGSSTFMERYLIRPDDLATLDSYEGAPDLYSLVELPDGTGYFYAWNLGFTEWTPSVTGDFRSKISKDI